MKELKAIARDFCLGVGIVVVIASIGNQLDLWNATFMICFHHLTC